MLFEVHNIAVSIPVVNAPPALQDEPSYSSVLVKEPGGISSHTYPAVNVPDPLAARLVEGNAVAESKMNHQCSTSDLLLPE